MIVEPAVVSSESRESRESSRRQKISESQSMKTLRAKCDQNDSTNERAGTVTSRSVESLTKPENASNKPYVENESRTTVEE